MPFRFFVAAGLLLLVPTLALGNAFPSAQFIQQRALDPIKLQTGLPGAASRLHTSDELQIEFVHNNVFMGGLTESERLSLDGESSQINLRYRRKLSTCWQLNANASWLAHSAGWYDNPVDDWHQFFNLPDAQRSEWPSNQLEYAYEKNGDQQEITENLTGLGDAQLQVQRYIGCHPNSTILRAGIKIPIGSPATFTGNNGFDAFVDLQSPWWQSKPESRWQWAGSIGLLQSGNSDLVAEQRPLISFGVLGLNYALGARSQLLAQIDWHTSMFDSELRELREVGAQLTLGIRYAARRGDWEVSFSEDAAVDTMPDIAVRLAWTTRFGNMR